MQERLRCERRSINRSKIGEPVMINAPLTVELKEKLDAYVCSVLDSGGYASLSPDHRLLRGLTHEQARDALMVYAEISMDWCMIDPVKIRGRYHLMGYRDEPAVHRLFDPGDYKVIDRYIAARSKPVVINAKLVARTNALKTRVDKHWLLMRSYFGLRPGHKILWRGALTDKEYKDRFYDTYLVGSQDSMIDVDEGFQIARELYEAEMKGAA